MQRILLDAIMLAIMIIFGYRGLQTGFSKSVIGIARFVLGALAGLFWSDNLSRFFYSKSSFPIRVHDWLAGLFGGMYGSQYYLDSMTAIIVRVLSFLIIYFTLWLVFQMILVAFDKIAKLPVLKQLDRSGGVLLGLAKGYLICILVGNIVFLIASFGVKFLTDMCNNSVFLPYVKFAFVVKWFKDAANF